MPCLNRRWHFSHLLILWWCCGRAGLQQQFVSQWERRASRDALQPEQDGTAPATASSHPQSSYPPESLLFRLRGHPGTQAPLRTKGCKHVKTLVNCGSSLGCDLVLPRCAEHQEALLELLFPMAEFQPPEMNGFLARCEQGRLIW